MSDLDDLIDKLWKHYSSINPQAGRIHQALVDRGEKVLNDHVAFRTFGLSKVDIDVLAAPFEKLGFRTRGEIYSFKEKKLYARHYDHADAGYPKIFISALQVGKFSGALQKTVGELVDQIPVDLTRSPEFLFSGPVWKPVSHQTYLDLLRESEYAAWMAAFGFRVNHFTVFFNALKTFKALPELNEFIKGLGYPLNASGGEIKGSPQTLLEQSSTLAYPVNVEFADKKESIPGCYYEFAKRHPLPDGKLFQGFLPQSADKIFESTHSRKDPSGRDQAK